MRSYRSLDESLLFGDGLAYVFLSVRSVIGLRFFRWAQFVSVVLGAPVLSVGVYGGVVSVLKYSVGGVSFGYLGFGGRKSPVGVDVVL